MFSSIINRVFTLVIGMEFLVAMFPDFPIKEDMQVGKLIIELSMYPKI